MSLVTTKNLSSDFVLDESEKKIKINPDIGLNIPTYLKELTTFKLEPELQNVIPVSNPNSNTLTVWGNVAIVNLEFTTTDNIIEVPEGVTNNLETYENVVFRIPPDGPRNIVRTPIIINPTTIGRIPLSGRALRFYGLKRNTKYVCSFIIFVSRQKL